MNDINCGFATTFHLIMSQEKVDKGDTEMNVHGGEIEDAELDPEKERSWDPVGRTRRVNMQDREDFEAEEMSQARRSPRGYLARVSTVINQVKIGIAEARECEESCEVKKNLEQAWARYSDTYQSYILKNLPVEEFEPVEQRYSKIYDDYSPCVKTVEDYSRPSTSRTLRSSLKSSNMEPKLSSITSSQSRPDLRDLQN